MTDMIILRERVITIKAGDTFDQSLQGNVLRVTAGLVPLRVQDRDQQMDFTLLAGERAEFPGEFPGLILSHTSGVDQQFTIQVGKGVNVASALVSGTVTITGTPNVNIANNKIKVVEDGGGYGAAFSSLAVLTANTPVTVFSPGSNTNGATVLRASLSGLQTGGGPLLSLVAKSSGPSAVTDGDVILSAPYVGGGFSYASMDDRINIAAGKGLYLISSITLQSGFQSVLYRLN